MNDSQVNYAPWLISLSSELKHPFAKDSWKMVLFLRELESTLPIEHKWRLTDIEGFKAKIDRAKTSGSEVINQVYWEDMGNNFEAWAIMSIWRGIELLDSAILSLNSGRYVSAATLARSLLEISTVMITEANNFDKTISSLSQPKPNQVVASKGLEELVLRLIWGARQSDTPEYLKQKNILSYLQRLAKNPSASELTSIYDYLCEAAHPNAVGYSRFYAAKGNPSNDQIVVRMSSSQSISQSSAGNELLEQTLWAIGWSSICLRNSYHIFQESIKKIDQLFCIRKKPRLILMPNSKVGRNDPCPCHSGKKFKHCHGNKNA